MDEVVNIRIEFENADENLSEFISWQDSEQGKSENIPRIEERHKEIVLKVEEIPPLDIFYSPKHRAVVRKQRKIRRIDQGPLATPQVELMNIVLKNIEVNPSEDLTKLSQYAGAYSAATIDKATKVTQMIKQKYLQIALLEEKTIGDQQRILQLEQQLEEEKLRAKQLEEHEY